MKKLKRYQHRDRDLSSGRYRSSPLCDGCNKPVGTNYLTDGDVCGDTDGPGFFRCERKRCVARLENLGVEERRAIYETNRANRKE